MAKVAWGLGKLDNHGGPWWIGGMVQYPGCARCGAKIIEGAMVFREELEGDFSGVYHWSCFYVEYYARAWRWWKRRLWPWRNE